MPNGKVKWFDPKKGYGFLIDPEGRDVFIHFTQIQIGGFKTLADDQWVEYELDTTTKGLQALNICLLEAEP